MGSSRMSAGTTADRRRTATASLLGARRDGPPGRRVAERDDDPTTAAKLDVTLADLALDDDDGAGSAPRLRPPVGLDSVAEATYPRDELFAAWRRFFERMAERGTTVLVFEDLQWANAGLVEFIESLLEWSRSHRILIVTLARPELLERHPTWGAGQREFTSISLEPLDDAAMTELVQGLAPGLPSTAAAAIVSRAEGVPLYAVELFRMLLDRRLVEGVEGRYRPVREDLTLAIPETLQLLIAARLDALPPGERRLVQDASVLGKTFTLEALAAISGEPATDWETRCADWSGASSSPSTPTRGHPSAANTGSWAHWSGRSRTARWRVAIDAPATSPRRDTSRRSGTMSWLACSPRITWPPDAASPPGPEAEAVAVQARVASGAPPIADRRRLARGRGDVSPAGAGCDDDPARDAGAAARPRSRRPPDEQLGRICAGGAGRTRGRRELDDQAAVADATVSLSEYLFYERELDPAIASIGAALTSLGDTDLRRSGRVAGPPRSRRDVPEPARGGPRGRRAGSQRSGPDRPRGRDRDLILTRAWACALLGRWREAVAENYGAMRLADEQGATATYLRAVNNLGSIPWTSGPRKRSSCCAGGVPSRSVTATRLSRQAGLRRVISSLPQTGTRPRRR